MGLFKKESGDIIDYTLLQKKGILKLPKKKPDVIDFTKEPILSQDNNIINSSTQTGNANPFGFLDSLAGASSTSSFENNNPINSSQTNDSSQEVNALKLKIEDLEYKLERINEKLDKLLAST